MSTIQMTTYCKYAHINLDMLQAFWLSLRCMGVDLMKIIRYTSDSVEELQKGWFPTGTESNSDYLGLFKRAEELSDFAISHMEGAKAAIKETRDFYEAFDDDRGYYVVFAKCDDGVICVAWSNADRVTAKAKLLAAFTLYALGKQSKADHSLWDATTRFLHWQVCPALNLADAEELIDEYRIKKKVRA